MNLQLSFGLNFEHNRKEKRIARKKNRTEKKQNRLIPKCFVIVIVTYVAIIVHNVLHYRSQSTAAPKAKKATKRIDTTVPQSAKTTEFSPWIIRLIVT